MFKFGNKEQDKEIRELEKQIAHLEAELRRFKSMTRQESIEGSREKIKLTSWFWNVILSMRTLVGTLDREVLLDSLFKLLKNGIGATSIQLFMLDGEELYPLKMEGEEESPDAKEMVIKVGADNIPGWVAQNAQMVSIRNLEQNLAGYLERGPVETVLCAPLMTSEKVYGVINISRMGERELEPKDEQFLSLISSMAGMAMQNSELFYATKQDLTSAKHISFQQLEEKKRLRSLFERYVSVEVVEEILNNSELLALGGNRQVVTVLFADIRGFTTLSESMAPEEVVTLLNEALSELTEILFKFGGTLDKYMGDCVMALFGVPVAMKDSAARAVLAGNAMVERIAELRQKWAIEGKGPIDIGIAINTGEAVVGNVGSEKRMDYTAIGDTVNITSRLEDMAEAGQILISASTYNRVQDVVDVEPVGKKQLRGKTRAVEIFRIKKIRSDVDMNRYSSFEVDQMEITQQYSARKIDDFSRVADGPEKKVSRPAQSEGERRAASTGKRDESGDSSEPAQSKTGAEAGIEPRKSRFSKEYKMADRLFGQGMMLAKSREYAQAIKKIEKAIQLIDDEPRFHYGLGLVHYKNRDLTGARESFARTIRLDPEFTEAHTMMNAIDPGRQV